MATSSLSLTTLIGRVESGDSQAEIALFKRLYQRAWHVARTRISPILQARVGPSDVAVDALRSLFSDLQNSPRGNRTRTEVEDLLMLMVRRKAARAAERVLAEGRNPLREAGSVEFGVDCDSNDLSPVDEACVAETIEEVFELLIKNDDRVRSASGMLLLLSYSPQEAREELIRSGSEWVPSINTIRLWRNDIIEDIKQRLS